MEKENDKETIGKRTIYGLKLLTLALKHGHATHEMIAMYGGVQPVDLLY